MSREPVAEDRTVWRCPVCSERFDMRQSCEIHMKDRHPEPTPEALSLIGSYLRFRLGDTCYIMRAEQVPEGDRVCGPAASFGWDGTVDFLEHHWIRSDAVEHTVVDEDEAGELWRKWCTDFANRLLNRMEAAWELMLSKEEME